MEQKNHLQEAIKAAQEAAAAASPEMKEKAFEIVLAHLLSGAGAPVPAYKKSVAVSPAAAESDTHIDGVFDTRRVATQLEISEDQVSELYEMKGSVLHLTIKPIGARLSDRQRNLAHALVIGYRLGLNIKEVSISTINDAAEEWNIRDSNLGRNLKDSKEIQMRGGGKGKKPSYSLAPNAIERVRNEILSMFAS